MAGVRHMAHRIAVNINRAARPLLGGLAGSGRYDAIRGAFAAIALSAADFTCHALNDADAAALMLMQYGIVVLPGLIDPALADAARREADQFIGHLRQAMAGIANAGVAQGIFWQVGGARFPNYRALSAYGRPVANMTGRQGECPNGGIIDLFCADQAARDNRWRAMAACCEALAAAPVARLIGAVSRRQPGQFHLLRNDSIADTRGLHWDNLNGFYKAFLYLGPVRRPDDGAYAYVPGTHQRLDLIRREARLNSLAGRREQDSFAFKGHEIPVLGEAGTVILSCQDGIHRGMPQRQGASRTMLVCNYHA